jgi:hypothetical protein
MCNRERRFKIIRLAPRIGPWDFSIMAKDDVLEEELGISNMTLA